ncbi:MAG TPA: hypothetical protein VF547_08240 [Allosphingosinicella sp.]|jgi:hypothetical protein
MSTTLILAAFLSAAPAAAPADARSPYRVDRSLSDADRLSELRIDVTSAYDGGRIDRATATEFYLAIERIRRQMIRMGIQVGYRQRVRLRARIDGLYARWAKRQSLNAEVRSGK